MYHKRGVSGKPLADEIYKEEWRFFPLKRYGNQINEVFQYEQRVSRCLDVHYSL